MYRGVNDNKIKKFWVNSFDIRRRLWIYLTTNYYMFHEILKEEYAVQFWSC